MQHIVNVAFDFDDEKVKQSVEKTVENEMDKIIKEIILDKIAPMEYAYYLRRNERNWENFRNNLNNHIKEFLEEHKEEILDHAADKLVESLKRTKAWKEKYEESTM